MKTTRSHNTTRYYLCTAIMWIMMAGATAFGQTFYSQTVTNDQALAYWNFDEASGNAIQQMPVPTSPTTVNDLVPASAASRVGHTAIASGLVLGNAADLDGASSFGTASTANFGAGVSPLPGPYVFEFWMQGLGGVNKTNEYIMSYTPNFQSGFRYAFTPDVLDLFTLSFGATTGAITISQTNADWHHVVFVFYGSLRSVNKVDAYLDGVVNANIGTFNRTLNVANLITVGDYKLAGGNGFQGRLDEMALYDWRSYTNLSQAQLSAKALALVNDHRLAATVDAAGVTVNITQQPANATGFVGNTTNFTVAATASSGSLAYQWQKNWQDIPGATNASYTTPALSTNDSGAIFRARVSSSNVFTYSREAALVVKQFNITISQQPTNVTTNVAQTVVFSVVATSSPPTQLSYQWKKNGLDILNATNASYTRVTIHTDVGTNFYNVRVRAGADFVDSDTAALVVAMITNGTGQYSQVVSNDLPLAYWNFDETNTTDNAIQQMPVPASPTTVNDLVPAFGATRVAHTAAASGLLLGNAGDFTTAGNFNAPAPDLGPSADLPGPYAIEFWLQVQGAGAVNVPLGFDSAGDRSIYYNNVPNALELYGGGGGRTGAGSISINTTNRAWHHVVYVFYGSLRAANKVDGYLDGVRLANISGYDRSLRVAGPLTVGDYRPAGGAGWIGRLDEVAIYDWTSYTNISEIQLSAKATAMVNDHLLAAINNVGDVTVNITLQPTNTTGFVGGTTNLTVAATASGAGAGTLMYQWQKNWQDIPGATSASYTTPTLTAGDSGAIFRARVSSSNAFTYSREATLTVQGFTITISQQPTNVSASIGAAAVFSVVATSSPPTQLSYQWKKNGANIPNETNASYTIPVIKLQHVGTNLFRVRVSVGASFVDSDEVALVVAAPAPINTSYSQIVSNDLPLAYWNFDEAQGNAIQLMPVPSSPTTVNDLVPAFGAFRADHAALGSGLGLGYCAEFNGANNFNTPAPDLGQTVLFTPYAVEFWLQVQGVSGGVNVPLGFDNAGDRSIYYNNFPNYLEIYGGPGGRTGAGGLLVNTTNTDWHHVVYVFYGALRATNFVDGYLDGVRLANIPGYDQGLRLVGPLTVGDYRPAGGAGWRGRLDEVAIYDFSAFADEASLTNHVNDLVARHFAAAFPVLSFTRAGSQLTLSWTVAGLVLQETASLSPPLWTDVPGGSNSPVTVTIGPASKFFSLRKP